MDYTMPKSLINALSFSRREFELEMNKAYGLNMQQSKYDLQKKLDQGAVVRAGWNHYSANKDKRRYSYDYSIEANETVSVIESNYYDLGFRIFELRQLNQFVNHLIACNAIVISVENEMVDFVFDTLSRAYPGKVLLKPSLDMYYRYQQDNEIIIIRLPSEAPKGFERPWETRLEKIIVDVLVDKLIGGIVPDGEKQNIVDGAFGNYLVDEATMVRYAKRKGAEKKLLKALNEYGRTIEI
jgi:hypothetical protein